MHLPAEIEMALSFLEEYRQCNPDELVQRATPFIDYFKYGKTDDQQMIRQNLLPKYFGRLRGYATLIASRAINTRLIEDIDRGLLACALEGGRYDSRCTLITLCLLHHSAKKLGADPNILFDNAIALGTEFGKQLLLDYLVSGNKNIEAMGYREGVDENGEFKYVSIQ